MTDGSSPPARDWRDWFIMATVTSGVSYGLYVAAKVRSSSHCVTDESNFSPAIHYALNSPPNTTSN